MRGLGQRWDRLTATEKVIWQGTVWASLVYLLHFDLYSLWFVEDAAISFSFAQNFATGEGLVAYPGGEPVEGFSNPTWTLSLAFLGWIGLSPWVSAKLIGALAGLATLPLAALWVVHLRGKPTPYAALAPLLLALSPQFVAWNAAGLESCLFTLLLASGSLCLLRQINQPSLHPWSGLIWFLLAITRPEGPAYVAIGVGIASLWILKAHGLSQSLKWLSRLCLTLIIPFITWHIWRYHYFGWEFPSTYYAKLGTNRFSPWGWHKSGWKYLRGFSLFTAQGFLIPIYVLGQTGLRGKAPIIGLAACFFAYLLTFPGVKWVIDAFGFMGITWEDPKWLITARVVTWGLIAVSIPFLGLKRPGASGRTLAWAFSFAVLFYTLYVGGDWMSGYRWLSFLILPLLVLLTDSLITILEDSKARGYGNVRFALAGLPLVVTIIVGSIHSGGLISRPETSPYDVRRRVLYIEQVRQQLDIDHITQMEVDMGAHLWWGDAHYIDMVGLTDVPMAQHKWQRPFIQEYVYEERSPEFAHVHGSWAKRTKVKVSTSWRNYIEMPPYPANIWNRHEGNFIRRDLVFQDEWPGTTGRMVLFDNSVELSGWHAPSLPVSPGDDLKITLGWRRGRVKAVNFKAYLFIANDEQVVLKEALPIYGWLPAPQWRRSETAISHHSVAIPSDFKLGRYDLGIMVIHEETGKVLSASLPSPPATIDGPRVANGEVRWPKAIGVVEEVRRDQAADRRLRQMTNQAAAGNCDAASNFWRVARNYYSDSHPSYEARKRNAETLLARCYSLKSVSTTDSKKSIEYIATSLRWDHRDPEVNERALQFAIKAAALGDQQLALGNLEAAYNSWHEALIADPSQARLRRRAEELRDQRHAQEKEAKKSVPKSTD